jgi:hypothetical protein
MQVNTPQGEAARTEAAHRAQHGVIVLVTAARDSAPVSDVRRGDGVQISDAGLALSSTDGAADGAVSGVDSRHADEIRSKILSGAYNTLEVADQVARALIRSGDL